MQRIYITALTLLLLTACAESLPASDAGATTEAGPTCAGMVTPDVHGMTFTCEYLGLGPECTWCTQTGASRDAGAGDVYSVFSGTCVCP